MNKQTLQASYEIVRCIDNDIKSIGLAPLPEETPSLFVCGEIIATDLFKNTRGYFQKLAYQINKTYDDACYDACALLIRKLVELLIEEVYENKGRVNEIVFQENNQLFGLNQLITTLVSDNHWKLNRNVEEGLNLIKSQGDKSAHNRRYNAKKSDIEKVKPYIRDIIEELLYLTGLK